jgi:predicted nucleic-acid-binding Zn-ribbon protein
MIEEKASYIGVILQIIFLVNWLYIITCKKCGYISTEKLSESKGK